MKPISYASALLGALFCLALAPRAAAASPDLAVEARLIWGTNGQKPPGEKLKEVDVETKKKLKRVFKWEHYYEVEHQDFKVPISTKKRVRMSPKCEVEVENLGESSVEVKLYGEGRLVVRKKQVLEADELLVLGGDDKNDTAWFVILVTPKK